MKKRPDSYWMQRCLTLAAKGSGMVSPNPMVGAVIVKDGKVLGEGFHRQFGGPHAEIEALRDADLRRHDPAGATMYVSLEPCSHTGKTPPCTEALISNGIARVVAAVQDPNPKVSGRGIAKLRRYGIRCDVGVMEEEARTLNRTFFTYISAKRPFVAVKAAQTADGFIARPDGSSQWITNLRSRTEAHRLRTQFDAVMVGAGTVVMDDPSLNVRHVEGRDPVRIVVDGRFTVPVTAQVFRPGVRRIFFTSRRSAQRYAGLVRVLTELGVEVIALPAKRDALPLDRVMTEIGKRGIASVLIEGGQQLSTAALNAGVVHALYLFTARKKFGSGIRTFGEFSVSFRKQLRSRRTFAGDELREYSVTYRKRP
ncbi:MAG: bifunctional diaminohydroxyphosphoribosylaminopyrimidine deaminase/5-amino-6-(5-phosphoribosylamino)uracil reductase RibD [Bacteroidetes bacterium]|nr:bifunctional diaminohydroxyphosphoribosylaminopyrimidine deaminase/5-amino-6-(5-phosphoribosylamino)uracil reductase RibD [Bacteroidota bacterium]